MFLFFKREEKNETQVKNTHNLRKILWQHSFRCKMWDTRNSQCLLQPQQLLCSAESQVQDVTLRKNFAFGLCFSSEHKRKEKNLEEYLVSQAVQHLQHIPPTPCSLRSPFWHDELCHLRHSDLEDCWEVTLSLLLLCFLIPTKLSQTSGTLSSSNTLCGTCPPL